MQRTVRAITTKKDTMIAWGWDAATSISGINSVHKTIAYVDAIETGSMPTLAIDRIIPTTWTHAKHLNQKNKSSHIVTEPLVGIHSNTLVVDRASVYQGLGVQASSPIVTTLNNRGDWKQLVAFLVQMRSLGEEVILVIPNEYDWYSELYFALEEHGLEHALRQVTTGLRLIDIVHSSAIAWAPTSTVKGSVEGILDVLNAAASGIPTVTSFDHPIAGLPTVGSRIAQVTSSIEFCAWVKALLQTPQKESDLALELGARIRSIASPSRFVEGLQLRLQ
jgi:hypothetical protein